MEDYLTSFRSRIDPLVSQSDLMFDAAIHAHSVLHPGIDTPDDPQEVAKAVVDTAASQMELYCTSAARAGADDALSTVLSWYEGIDVEKLKGLRAGSKWLTNEDLVKKRKALAIDVASYTDINELFIDPSEPIKEATPDEDEEQVDEEIDMEAAAARTGAASADAGTSSSGTAAADAGAADAGAANAGAADAGAAEIVGSATLEDSSAAP
jgi:hypothetical protein